MMALPAVLFVMLYGFMQWPRLLRNGALAIVVGTALYMVLFSFHSGTYTRADWRGVADAVEERWQPGDVIVAEPDNVRLAFERYFEPNEREATAHVTLLTGLDEQAISAEPRRVWVLYRNPIEDVHRQGTMPAFDPFKRGLSAIGDWLAERRDQCARSRLSRRDSALLRDATDFPGGGDARAHRSASVSKRQPAALARKPHPLTPCFLPLSTRGEGPGVRFRTPTTHAIPIDKSLDLGWSWLPFARQASARQPPQYRGRQHRIAALY